MNQREKDERVRELHTQAGKYWLKFEIIIDELKELGPHSLDGDNAILNIREHLHQLSNR